MKSTARSSIAVGFALMVGMDIWFALLRCRFSPAIDWNRLAFGIVLQVGVLVGSWFGLRLVTESGGRSVGCFAVVVIGAAARTYFVVRQPILFSDTINNKYFGSGSYKCPGVPRFWRPGVNVTDEVGSDVRAI